MRGGQTPVTPATVEDDGGPKAAPVWAGGQTGVVFGTTPAGWGELPTKKVTDPKGLRTPTTTPKSPSGRGNQGHGGR